MLPPLHRPERRIWAILQIRHTKAPTQQIRSPDLGMLIQQWLQPSEFCTAWIASSRIAEEPFMHKKTLYTVCSCTSPKHEASKPGSNMTGLRPAETNS